MAGTNLKHALKTAFVGMRLRHVLRHVGTPYALELVSIPNGEQQAPQYLSVNPRSKVPTLRTDDGVLTENVAILTYIARSFPHAGLLPEEPIAMARCLSHMAYLSNTVHVGETAVPSRTAHPPGVSCA